VLVTCSLPVDDTLVARLVDAAAGVTPARFMPERSLLFFVDHAAVERLAAVEGVARVDHMRPAFKASSSLGRSAQRASKHPAVANDPRTVSGTTLLQVTTQNCES
jgi:hypothetical protein